MSRGGWVVFERKLDLDGSILLKIPNGKDDGPLFFSNDLRIIESLNAIKNVFLFSNTFNYIGRKELADAIAKLEAKRAYLCDSEKEALGRLKVAAIWNKDKHNLCLLQLREGDI